MLTSTEAISDESLANKITNSILNESKSNTTDSHLLKEFEISNENNQIDESQHSLSNVVIEKSQDAHNDSILEANMDDILGNKSLLKQTITLGIPDTRPTRNSIANVSYTLYLIDDTTEQSRFIETITNENFFISECDILPAIDISIQLMERGEHALIYSDVRHCYGEIGCEEKQIPSISLNNKYRMKIDLEFHDWKYAPDIQKLSIDERLYWGDKKRQIGNFSYRRKEYSTALQCYRNALKFLNINQYPLLEENSNSSLLNERYIQVQNNLAQVYLLNNQYDQCLDAVNEILTCDSTNVKALFRKAKAFFELGNYDQTILPLKLLLESQSKDVDREKVYKMLNICEAKLAKYKQNEKEICERMFSSSSSSTATTIEEKLQTKNMKKIQNKNNKAWRMYVTMGSAVIVGIAVALAAFIQYR